MALNADAPPPPLASLLSEWPRAAWTIGTLPLAWSQLLRAPRGDGRPVLVLPGLVNGDNSNLVLRHYLNTLGYRAYPWALGRNFGPRAIGAEGERLFARIAAIHDETGAPVTLVGVSLGGIMARIAAHRHPATVRAVVTICSPFAGLPSATNVVRVFETVSGQRSDDPAVRALLEEAAQPPPVPTTAIWSRTDGLVNGAVCHDADCDRTHNIEVASGHLLAQMAPDVLRAVAGALARDQSRSSSPAR